MIEWVFFDVGNVLFNDDPQNFFAYRRVHERIQRRHRQYTFEEMLAERETHARRGANWILHKIARRLLSEDESRDLFVEIRKHLLPNYDDYHLINHGLFETLEQLRDRYRLGIIANQPPECRDSLRRRELLEWFDVVAISEELNLHKPDARLYEWAVGQAGCEPSRAVMVGDRYDNDVSPAQSVSMRTILLRWPGSHGKNWQPDDPQAQTFLKSCDSIPLFSPLDEGTDPDQVIESLFEIPTAVESIAGRADDEP